MKGRELQQTDSRFVIQQERFGQLRRFLETAGREGRRGRDPVRSRRLVAPARFARARLQLPDARDRSTCAWIPASSPSAAEWLNAAEEREIASVLRRLGEEPAAGAHRPRDLRAPRRTADRHHDRSRRHRCPGRRSSARRQASRDEGVPGDPHLHQSRARGARGRARPGPRGAARRRPPVRHQLPLPRGPHRQALPARPAPG